MNGDQPMLLKCHFQNVQHGICFQLLTVPVKGEFMSGDQQSRLAEVEHISSLSQRLKKSRFCIP